MFSLFSSLAGRCVLLALRFSLFASYGLVLPIWFLLLAASCWFIIALLTVRCSLLAALLLVIPCIFKSLKKSPLELDV